MIPAELPVIILLNVLLSTLKKYCRTPSITHGKAKIKPDKKIFNVILILKILIRNKNTKENRTIKKHLAQRGRQNPPIKSPCAAFILQSGKIPKFLILKMIKLKTPFRFSPVSLKRGKRCSCRNNHATTDKHADYDFGD